MKKFLLAGFVFVVYYATNYLTIHLSLFFPELNDTIVGDYNGGILLVSLYVVLLITYYWLSKISLIRTPISVKAVLLPIVLVYLYSMSFDLFYRSPKYEALESISFNFSLLDDLLESYFLISILEPLFEELFFRGLLLNQFKKNNVLFGVILISFLYALSHFYYFEQGVNFDYVRFLNLFILGGVFSLISLKYGVLYAILSHIFYNTIIFLNEFNIVDLFILDYVQSLTFYFSYLLVLLLFVLLVVFLIIVQPPNSLKLRQ